MAKQVNQVNEKYGIPVPLTLTCTKSGKVVKYTRPEYIKRLIEKAGSLETLLASYVCKAARPPKPVKVKKVKEEVVTEAPAASEATEAAA